MARDGDTYVLPSSEEEAQRLELQARLYGGLDFLEPFLAREPGRILDVGCGTGHFTRLVAERLPGAEVVGLDMDESRLAFARSLTVGGNVEYVPGDLGGMPLPADGFDLVFGRFVLIHQSDPARALDEMVRATRPGGRVVAYDMVHEGIWFSPPKPAFARFLRATLAVMREGGAEPNQGLHLYGALLRAGLEEVSARTIPHQALGTESLYEAYRRNWIATVRSLAEELGPRFEAGLAEAALEDLETRAPGELLLEVTVLASGRKATGAVRDG